MVGARAVQWLCGMVATVGIMLSQKEGDGGAGDRW